MVKVELLSFLCIIVILISCKKSSEIVKCNSIIDIQINDIDKDNCISMTKDKYFKSFRYIQLETDTSMLIGRVDKIVLGDERIYIADSRSTQTLFIFDKNGNFVNKINCYGEGPMEYQELTDIFYDEQEKTINILSYVGRSNYKIMVFDKDGDKLLKQLPIPLSLSEVVKSNDNLYICNSKHILNNSSSNNRLTVYTNNFQKLYDAVSIAPQWQNKMMSVRSELYKNKMGNVFCIPEHSTDVYQIMTDSVILCYHYDFGKYTYPEKFNNPEEQEKLVRNWEINNYVDKLEGFSETDELVVATVLFKGAYRIIFYNKKSRTAETYNLLNNPFIVDGFGRFICINNDCVIVSKTPDTFLSVFEDTSIMGEEATNVLKNLFKRPMKEDDNPIIGIYELK